MNSRIILGVFLLIIIGYGAIKAIPLIRGPRIAISTLSTDQNGLMSISGNAIHTETLSLDDGPLLIDSDGAFKKTLTLPRGGAIISITATDRFGRSKTLERTVITP